MSARRFLVTGGAGFIGSHLCDHLLAQGHSVRALDVLSPQVHRAGTRRPAYLDPHVELQFGDVRDRAAARRRSAASTRWRTSRRRSGVLNVGSGRSFTVLEERVTRLHEWLRAATPPARASALEEAAT